MSKIFSQSLRRSLGSSAVVMAFVGTGTLLAIGTASSSSKSNDTSLDTGDIDTGWIAESSALEGLSSRSAADLSLSSTASTASAMSSAFDSENALLTVAGDVMTDMDPLSGLMRHWNTATTYWLDRPNAASTDCYWDNVRGLQWCYVRQEIFTEDPVPHGQQQFWVGNISPQTLADRFLGTETIDEYGGLWVVVAIDDETVQDRIDAAMGAADLLFGAEVSGSPYEPDDPITSGYVTGQYLSSWSVYDCDAPSSYFEEFVYGSDSRAALSLSSITSRQEKIVNVQYHSSTGIVSTCSGVMVADDVVLTAAHCLFDGTGGSSLRDDSFDVCTLGNRYGGAECVRVENYLRRAGTDSSPSIGKDFALLYLTAPITSVGTMSVSSISNAELKSKWHYSAGYPSYVPGSCSSGTGTDTKSFSFEVNSGYYAHYYSNIADPLIGDRSYGITMYSLGGNVTSTYSDSIRLTHDATAGQSGSPLWYCGGTGCSKHYITGLINVFTTGGSMAGPKGPKQMQPWVLTNK